MKNVLTLSLLSIPLIAACSGGSSTGSTGAGSSNSSVNYSSQVYVVSEHSDELFIIDVEPTPPVAVGSVDTNLEAGHDNENHMAIVSEDGTKIYITATHQDQVVVVERESLSVIKTIPVGMHPSHGNVRQGFAELWIVNEDSNSVSVIDTDTDSVKLTITDPSFIVPHHVRFDVTSSLAYIPSIGGNQVTIIDALNYAVMGTLVPEGQVEGPCAGDPCGFADAQIDPDGFLYAAHIGTGSVVVYDTVTSTRLGDIPVGPSPWMAYVDLFGGQTTSHYLVPNFDDSTLSRIDAVQHSVTSTIPEGDTETYGVNYSPLAPDLAFVMNRNRGEVTVIDLVNGQVVERIPTGGTIETACTTDDGKYVIAPISDVGEVMVIDAVSLKEVARFKGVGTYPWTAATLGGQNYCH